MSTTASAVVGGSGTCSSWGCGIDGGGVGCVVGNEVGELTLVSPTAPGVTRKWTRLQDYSDEVANARIYAGFHYRFSAEAGKDMGKNIAELTVSTQLLGNVTTAKSK